MALFEDEKVFMEQLLLHGLIGLAKMNDVTPGAIMYYKRKWDKDRKVKVPLTYKVYDGSMVATDSYGRKFTFDEEEYQKVVLHKWYAHQGYIKAMMNGKTILLHRHIMDCPDGMIVDHINHDTSDNRKSNLRIVTPSQNDMNRKISKNNNSGVKGVFFVKSRNKWRAEIHCNKKQMHLGIFHTFDEAKDARKKAEEKYFGDNAYNQ